nr:hypothetical protein [Tanacetum cinerariifolium]
MSTQQDIYAAGSKSRHPLVNKENYVPWSSHLLRYAKSRPNGKLIHKSIINGPYVRRMIPEPGDANREDIYVAVDRCETAQEIWLRVQQMMKGSDIGIQEKKAKLFNEWEREDCQQSEFVNNLQPEWSRHVTIVHQTKDLHTADYTQLYNFLKYNQKEVDELKAERLAKTQDPLALMTNSNNPYAFPAPHQDQPSFIRITCNNQCQILKTSQIPQLQIAQPTMNMGQDRQMQMVGGYGENQFRQYAGQNVRNLNGYNAVQNVRNQKEEAGIQLQAEEYDLTAAAADLDEIEEVNANCILMANLQQASTSSTQTNKAPVYDSDGSAEVHDYENCDDNEIFNMFTQEEQYTELLEPIPESHQVSQNDNNVISEVTSVEQGGEIVEQHPANFEETHISDLNKRLSKEKSTVSSLLEEKKKLKSDFKTREDELLDKQIQLEKRIKELNNILVKIGQSIQTIHMLSPKPYSFYHIEQKMALGHQNPFYLKQAQKKQQSLYDGKVLLEKHDPLVVHDSEKTLQLAQESHEKMKQLNRDIKPANYTRINHLSGVIVPQTAKSHEELYFSNNSKTANVSKSISIPNDDFSDDTTPSVARKFLNESSSAHQELHKIIKDENFPIVNQVDARVQNFEIQFLKEAAKFVGDFKSLANEADASLSKHKALELEIKCLLKAVVSQDIMNIVQKETIVNTSDLQTELERMKERFENYMIKKENEYAKLWNDCKNVELEFQVLNYARENAHFKATYKNLFDSISVSRTQTKTITASLKNELQTTIYKNAKLRTQLFKKVSDQKNNTSDTSANTKFKKQSIVENLPKVGETHALSKPVTLKSVSTPQEPKVVKHDKVISPGMFRINHFKTSREEKHMPNTVRASNRTKPITVSQPPVFTKKDVNSDSNGLSSTRIDNTKTRRPWPSSNTKNDRVLSTSKNSRSKNKEAKVEEHHRNLLLSKNNKHMSSACNNIKLDSQNAISKVVYSMCKKCLISVNHNVCLRNYVNGKNSRGRKHKANVSIKEKQKKHQPHVKKPKKVGFLERLATPKPRKSRFLLRWSPTGRLFDQKGKIVNSSESESQSDCSNGDNACTSNTLEPKIKRFPNYTSLLGRNDHVAAILGFGDLQWGNILITRVYFVEGLGHNLFSIGQFCDSDLEVAFRRNACFDTNLEGVDLLKGDRSTNLYTINLYEMASTSPICLMARASSTKSWLWHQRLSHLNFDTINDLARNDLVSGLPKFKYHKKHLFPSCEQGKSKRASHPPKPVPNSRQRLHLLHMDLCGPMRIASINGKQYVLVIVDDYSRYTWVHFLRSKDEAPEVIKTFLKRIIIRLHVGISPQMSSIRTPQQNGVVERRNRTLVEAARTMLIFSRAPLFLWAEAITTVCFTQNRFIIHRRFNKTPYELINGRKPDISFLYVFGALCYPKNDHEDIGKLGEKGDIGFFIGYSAYSCTYRIYNRRTKKIMETMNVLFDELSAMAIEQRSSKPRLQSMTSGQISSGLNLTYAPSIITTQQPTEGELDLLFEAMYDDYIGGQPSATARTVPPAQEYK